MAALIVEVAEAVKNALNAFSFSLAFTAVREWLPTVKMDQLDELRVAVVPVIVPYTRASRGAVEKQIILDVIVQEKPAKLTDARLSTLSKLVRAIAAYFQSAAGRVLASPDVVLAGSPEHPNGRLMIGEHLAELRQFSSVLRLTWKTV